MKISTLRGLPAKYIYNSSDWTDYTSQMPQPTGLGAGSGTWNYYKAKISGDSMEIMFQWTKDATAGSGAAVILMPLPNNIVASYTPDVVTTVGFVQALGTQNGTAILTGRSQESGIRITIPGGGIVYQGGTVSANQTFIGVMKVAVKGLTSVSPTVNMNATSPMYAGLSMAWPNLVAPTGWAAEDGSAVSQTTYPELYEFLAPKLTMSTVSGGFTVTVASTVGLMASAAIYGAGLPAGSTIAAITGPTTFSLYVAATATATVVGRYAPYDNQINPTTGANWAFPAAGTFRLPDSRGLFKRGAGTAFGQTATLVGSFAGSGSYTTEGMLTSDYARYGTNSPSTIGSPPGVDFNTQIHSHRLANVNPVNRGVLWIIKLFNDTWDIASFPGATATVMGFVSGNTGYPGSTSGLAPAVGKIGETFGTKRQGTGGFAVSERSTTALLISNQILLSKTLNKGNYLVGYTVVSTWSLDGYFQSTALTIGGLAAVYGTNQASKAGIPVSSGLGPVPITIEADGTVVAVNGSWNGGIGTATNNFHEMWIVRVS